MALLKLVIDNDNLRLWISILEYEKETTSAEPDQLRIETLANYGAVV